MVIYSDELRTWMKYWECPGGIPFLDPHWDSLGKVWDIGYGHVIRPDRGEDRRSLTPDEAEMLLDFDLAFYDAGVTSLVTWPLAQCQHDALVAFAYNKGLDIDEDEIAEGLGDSTLLKYVNKGNFEAAAEEFKYWNKAGGKIVPGLIRRSSAMEAMWTLGEYRLP